MSHAIKVTNLSKIYQANNQEKLALDKINLEVPEGSIFALLGPNGAGKSTLINILAGLVNKTSGDAHIMGHNIEEKIAKYLIGVVPQELTMDSFFPIYEALEIYAGYYGIKPGQRKTKEIIEALGLKDKIHNTAKQLSGGMKRRFLVAKAMVHSPKVLILDEPTAGVDIELREQLWDYVVKLNRENGTTIILTTHYLEEAEKLCDRIAFINHGKIIKSDTKNNLLYSLGSRQVTIEFTEEVTIIPEILSNYKCELVGQNKIKITFQTSEVTLGEILSQIQNLKLTIKDLVTSQPDLQSIFKLVVNPLARP